MATDFREWSLQTRPNDMPVPIGVLDYIELAVTIHVCDRKNLATRIETHEKR